jgi:hypothetical protein
MLCQWGLPTPQTNCHPPHFERLNINLGNNPYFDLVSVSMTSFRSRSPSQ